MACYLASLLQSIFFLSVYLFELTSFLRSMIFYIKKVPYFYSQRLFTAQRLTVRLKSQNYFK
ncbi:hypothetical protein SAMN05421579_10611 [Xenorhabdus japonica]|uniref:Uncharacterized protein n=1 Tax=Xenorhabdus japonica TaxID=53341 RepID=A0A1I4ZFJ0_9GAMM|nr:hypothetical protein SAMN05421579_10611 [Xenorhabdus japonica]